VTRTVLILRLAGVLFADAAMANTDVPDPAAIVGPSAADAAKTNSQKELCDLIESAAKERGLPVGFFTRLIWKESRFRSEAISPKGAQGIAQFMPYTAEERGLLDPFDPRAAIPASAHLLADLKARFGNLGLAAAAYNAGANRVTAWLAETATLPWETEDYVLAITGVAADTWSEAEEELELPKDDEGKDCLALAALLKKSGALGPEIETARGPWGVQVAGNFSRARAISVYRNLQKRYPALLAGRPPMVLGGRMRGRGTRAFYQVRVPMQSRNEAERFCADLQAAGGSCIVLKT
jgi:hypothetical protein